jgi:translation initiation factor IF-1
MKAIGILTALLLTAGAAAAQERDRGGGIGGVLDTIGGLLGGGLNKAHGTVVLARDNTVVFRTDDGRTLRVDTASLDADARGRLQAGQAATLSARGSGDVLTATDIQIDQAGSQRTFQRVSGTVQERTQDRILFRTREGLTLPVATSSIRGLPALKANDPATLIYEQGPRQELVAVWIEPGDAAGGATSPGSLGSTASDPMPSASLPDRRTVRGTVESIDTTGLTLQLRDGRRMEVDASGLDRSALSAVRPGDRVTVTGTPDAAQGRFVAASLTRAP